jgi:Ni,Fe-hydrogenase III large subunit
MTQQPANELGQAEAFPLGPYHPALPEPIWYQLSLRGETITRVEITTGYCQRGVEALLTRRSIDDGLKLAERLCGSAAHHHRLGFCLALERLAGIQPPPLARSLRSFFCEIERLLSHLSCAMRVAQAADRPRAFYAAVEARERLLEAMEQSTGQRLLWGLPIPGGVASKPDCAPLARELGQLPADLDKIERELVTDRSMQRRTRGLATITTEQARQLDLTGPAARASGLSDDARRTTRYDAYASDALDLPLPETDITVGNTAARIALRTAEMRASLKLTEQLLDTLPDGPLVQPLPDPLPAGEAEAAVEGPQGQETWHLRSAGANHLAEVTITTASQRNLAAVQPALEGQRLSDVLLILASLDLCIACIDK